MTFAVRSLASGSNGNSMLVRAAGGAVLVDAGLPLPQLEAVLQQAGADLLLLEANHQRERLANCGYPGHLQRRVRGKLGHLANDQTATLLLALHHRDPRPRTVWLAHLSARSNTPLLALAEVGAALAAARISTIQLAIAPRGKPSSWWMYAPPLHQQSFWDAELALGSHYSPSFQLT